MPLWMLWLFAICMLSAVVRFYGGPTTSVLAALMFIATAVVFLATLVLQGIRRPVV